MVLIWLQHLSTVHTYAESLGLGNRESHLTALPNSVSFSSTFSISLSSIDELNSLLVSVSLVLSSEQLSGCNLSARKVLVELIFIKLAGELITGIRETLGVFKQNSNSSLSSSVSSLSSTL